MKKFEAHDVVVHPEERVIIVWNEKFEPFMLELTPSAMRALVVSVLAQLLHEQYVREQREWQRDE